MGVGGCTRVCVRVHECVCVCLCACIRMCLCMYIHINTVIRMILYRKCIYVFYCAKISAYYIRQLCVSEHEKTLYIF